MVNVKIDVVVQCVKFAAVCRNSRFPSNQVLNSLPIEEILTQHPTISEKCGGSMKRVKGNGTSKKLPPPHVSRRMSLAVEK